jgi:hypothetical protein
VNIYRLSCGIEQLAVDNRRETSPTRDKPALFGYKKRNQRGDIRRLTYGSQRRTVLRVGPVNRRVHDVQKLCGLTATFMSDPFINSAY